MSDGPWTKFQATETQGAGPWAKFAQSAKEVEVPDAVAQSREELKSGVGEVPPYPLPASSSNLGLSPYRDQKILETMKGPGKQLEKDIHTGAMAMAGGGIGGGLAEGLVPAAKGAAGTSKFLQWLLPALARGSGAGAGAGAGTVVGGGTPKEALGTAATVTGAEVGLSGLGTAAKAIKNKISPPVDPTRKINELLGVTQKEIKVGSTPETLSDFAQNPARGVIKSGRDEKSLAKMNPLERNIALTKDRNEVGAKLEGIFKNASAQGEKLLPEQVGMRAGKTVDFQKVMDSVFDESVIPDKALAKQTANRLQQILTKTKLNGKLLSQLTPTEAFTLRQELDEFANFAPAETARTFSQVATKLRRGLSDSLHKAVPESTEVDQHYSDMVGAVKAARRQAAEFAKSTPESKLRKWIIKAAVKTGKSALPGF